MANFMILYDEPQEAEWFRNLHISLAAAKEEAITNPTSAVRQVW